MTFVQRLISVSVQLAQNTQTNQPSTFSESGTNTVNLTGSRVSVQIENSGAPADSNARVKIWGLTPSIMNQLSTLGLVFNLVPKNTLTISAGDAVAGQAIVFSGTIWSAYGDYSAQPDVPFIFDCIAGAADATIAIPASSFSGSQQVSNMMSGFARAMNLGFENNGVSSTLSNAYFSGSARSQADKCAKAAGISWGIIKGNTLSIWPLGGNRNTPNIPVISAATGMISYPAFTQQGIIVKTLFNPQLSFGSLVQVNSSLLAGIASAQPSQQSSLSPGNAPSTFPSQWAVNKLDLMLDSLVPKGQWMSVVYAYNPGYAKTIIPPSS
jgi:hypothetical protein